MIKKTKIKNNDHEVVTKGFLREQLDNRLIPFEKNMNDRFEKFGEVVLAEFAAMRKDHKELMQRCDSLDRNDIRQEIAHDKFEQRVLNLEIAK